jgi:hypothetical protein
MGKLLLNGREPVQWELAAMERARQCELERDMQVLAGLLPGPEEPAPVHEGRPVTDIVWEFR